MDRYGIALSGFRGKVTCYPIKVDVDQALNVEILNDISFERHIEGCDFYADIIIPLKRACDEIIQLQETSFQKAGKNPEGIALYIGGTKGDNFGGWDLLERTSQPPDQDNAVFDMELVKQHLESSQTKPKNAIDALCSIPSRHIERITNELKREVIQTGTITPVVLPEDKIKITLELVRKFRNILMTSLVLKGNFNSAVLRFRLTVRDEDRELVRLRELWLEQGNLDAFEILKQNAYDEGAKQGKIYSKKPHYFAMETPVGYYKLSPEEKIQYAKYNYYEWHPDIEHKFHEGFQDNHHQKVFQHCQLPHEGPKPPYVTPLMSMIYTQDKISKGIMLQADLEKQQSEGFSLRSKIITELDGAEEYLTRGFEDARSRLDFLQDKIFGLLKEK